MQCPSLPDFKRVLRGYDPEEVNKVMVEVNQKLFEAEASKRELLLQINSLREFNTKWESRLESYQEMEKDIREAMLSAQRLADQVKEDSEMQAETRIRNAEIEAEKLLENAEIEAESLRECIAELMQEKKEMENQVEKVSSQVKLIQDNEQQSKQRIAEINKEEQQSQQSVSRLKESIKALVTEKKGLETQIAELTKQLELSRKNLQDAEKRIAGIKGEEQQAQAAATRIQESISELTLEQETLEAQIQKALGQFEMLRQTFEGKSHSTRDLKVIKR